MQYLSLPLRNHKPRQENGDITVVCFAVNVIIDTPINTNITSIITAITIITVSNITINIISTHFPHYLRLYVVPLTVWLLTPKYVLAVTRSSVTFFLREVFNDGGRFTKDLSQYTA